MKTKITMAKSIIFLLLGILAMVAATAMYAIGNSSGHLSELKDFWYMPIPFGLLFLIVAIWGFVKTSQKKT